MVAVFIYNILLIVLYTLTMSFAIFFYLKEKDKLFLIVTLFLAFFILDNIIIYMTEFINSFASSYNQIFMSIPAVKTIIFMVNAFSSLLIVTSLLKERIKPIQYTFLILMAVWMLSTPMLPNSALKVWLYYLPNQLFLCYLGCYTWVKYRLRADYSKNLFKYLKWISLICIISSITILIEDTFVIFNIDQYTSLIVKIYNRNLSEDFYSITACLLILRYLIFDVKEERLEAVDRLHLTKMLDFFEYFQFTQREQEIFQLLLDHKHNQEIADELFLSVGTVKTHVHNIFIKLNIKKRNQIFSKYEEFSVASEKLYLDPFQAKF